MSRRRATREPNETMPMLAVFGWAAARIEFGRRKSLIAGVSADEIPQITEVRQMVQ
jgi:hypothetical protein